MYGEEFWILEEFKFSSLNNMDSMFSKSTIVLPLSGAFSVDETTDLSTLLKKFGFSLPVMSAICNIL